MKIGKDSPKLKYFFLNALKYIGLNSFIKIIKMRSYHYLSPHEKKLWLKIRNFLPHNIRWFYEGFPSIPGHLWYSERKLLYKIVRRYKPSLVFEVGTWLGGGSTYFISNAIYKNGRGILHTIESDYEIYEKAVNNYNRFLKFLIPFTNFHYGISYDLYPTLLREMGKADMIFLDGANDPQQALLEYEMFEPYLSAGAILMAHDWCNEKMALLKPMIEKSDTWKLEQILLPPYSEGFAVAIKNF
ncbi:MAG: hypothetical protein A2Y62_01835 [Candidatus Fischerbacteria bacterium RBG_13_37_8]|uniref:Methyltransferase n=1 Tax=Candidatus Fischerbacteria bacterium RBG_13_37_8 TaxID=1817863 RepID=A0A1F5VDS7_9BACT|nr:MAG: hypothetical protein A2Y62_01835 [Candidatus Fischerbacteria bacterium RBG_13_37_8]